MCMIMSVTGILTVISNIATVHIGTFLCPITFGIVFDSFGQVANSVYVIRLWHHHSSLALLLVYVYSALGDIVKSSEFLCGIYIGTLLPLMHMK